MKLTDINIRDPYILRSGEWYYMYGTRAETCWGKADGFDCFKSKDLENWEGPFEIFQGFYEELHGRTLNEKQKQIMEEIFEQAKGDERS